METVADFVQRTDGPAMPFVPEWYPWIYAHHYLRLEAASLPAEFRRGATSISLGDARELIYLWCGLSGEGVQPAVRALADAYLRRWGMVRPGQEVDREVGPEMGPRSPSPTAAPGAVPVDGVLPVAARRPRRRRPVGRIPAPRGRTRRALVAPVAGAASST
jgi:hypothetical protein